MSDNILAFDPGFGNTKVCYNGLTSVVQSAVVKPVEVGGSLEGMKIAHAATSVKFDGLEFMVGRGAWNWGRALGSMDFGGIVGPERLALLYAALGLRIPAEHEEETPVNFGNCSLVIGLPVPLMMDEPQMAAVVASLKKLKREHVFTVQGTPFTMNVTRVLYRGQPMGAFYDWLLNDEFEYRVGASSKSVAVLDIGMNTLDLFVVENNAIRPGFLGGDKVGVRRLLDLANNGSDLAEKDGQLRDGRLKFKEGELDIWLSNVLDVVERTWPSLRRFDAVIPTGGGAIVLGNKLQAALAAKGAAIAWPADPITANVKGLWKHGETTRKVSGQSQAVQNQPAPQVPVLHGEPTA